MVFFAASVLTVVLCAASAARALSDLQAPAKLVPGQVATITWESGPQDVQDVTVVLWSSTYSGGLALANNVKAQDKKATFEIPDVEPAYVCLSLALSHLSPPHFLPFPSHPSLALHPLIPFSPLSPQLTLTRPSSSSDYILGLVSMSDPSKIFVASSSIAIGPPGSVTEHTTPAKPTSATATATGSAKPPVSVKPIPVPTPSHAPLSVTLAPLSGSGAGSAGAHSGTSVVGSHAATNTISGIPVSFPTGSYSYPYSYSHTGTAASESIASFASASIVSTIESASASALRPSASHTGGAVASKSKTTALLCADNFENLSGRVLVQVSPFQPYDTQKVLDHARRYVAALAKVGITKDRLCIKIPTTGPAMVAAAQLNKEGIRTLGTSLFAHIIMVRLQTRACREKEKYWPDLADPALEHPMIPRVLKIFEVYKCRAMETGQQQPLIKSASYLSVAEVLACAEIGVHHSTIPAGLLEKLRTLPATVASDPSVAHILPGIAKPADMAHAYSAPAVDRAPAPRLAHRLTTDPLTSGFTGKLDGDVPYAQEVDYLADGGKKLDEAIEGDVESKGRLVQALTGFQNHELVIWEIIDKEMKAQGFAK
ncbi:hypothetical protein C8F01DRAFT_1250480 [Mycena amicta]|nr:hypothetical protein C8F01DRAFT_1250480 [Mycena amicta]